MKHDKITMIYKFLLRNHIQDIQKIVENVRETEIFLYFAEQLDHAIVFCVNLNFDFILC